MKLQLIPNWKRAWRMYSVWWIVGLTVLDSVGGFVAEIRERFDLGLLASIGLASITGLAGIAVRLLSQPKVSRDGD